MQIRARRDEDLEQLEEVTRRVQVANHLPALDVVDIPTAAPAIALYRAEGWKEITRVHFELTKEALEEIVFVWPVDETG